MIEELPDDIEQDELDDIEPVGIYLHRQYEVEYPPE